MVYIEREIEKEIEKWLESREILAIRGPRQSGKTTLIAKLRDFLNKKGVKDTEIHYFNFENDLEKLKFQENPKEFIEFYIRSEKKNYFMFDEVQYVNDIGKYLKLIFDSFNNVKIIITGSSSFELTNLGSYLVGRILFFDLKPFSFLEFLRAKNEKYELLYKKTKIDLSKSKIDIKKTIFLGDLNKLLHEYLTFGSYPRIILEKDKDKKKELLKNLFTTYIEKDIVGLYGIKYREKVVKLLKVISSNLGNIINYESLSFNSGLKYQEVRELMPLLEDSFVISITKPFYKNSINEIRKNPKIYFIDYGFRNYLLENFENIRFDALYENFVNNQLKINYNTKYWRTTAKTEVDFVILIKNKIIPLEVKIKPKITRAIMSFMQIYRSKTGFILNLNISEKKKVDDCNLFMIPFVSL